LSAFFQRFRIPQGVSVTSGIAFEKRAAKSGNNNQGEQTASAIRMLSLVRGARQGKSVRASCAARCAAGCASSGKRMSVSFVPVVQSLASPFAAARFAPCSLELSIYSVLLSNIKLKKEKKRKKT
jgi:hypothetical protein